MKKQGLIAALFALCLTLSACGCNSTTAGESIPSTTTATSPSTSATTMPTMETNIPDPTVDSNSTEDGGLMGTEDMTGGTTGSTDTTHGNMG